MQFSLPAAQPAPERRSPPPASSPSLYTEHEVMWYQISLCLVWVSCPGCIPSQLPVKSNTIPAKTMTLSTPYSIPTTSRPDPTLPN